ncbi:6-phosphogluconate dehydrogenase C-terminal domain-like protein [Auriculariales sp. MPI-PUGE-AT-0066]|nr:6-phosphogluconate dehydrogenase C-terminal domain-like protein [Auriculariales sp. MPI-PUGE-AT-0066]
MSDSAACTIAIIAAGEMGAGLAARLTIHGCTVLTDLTDRSDSTRARAEQAGMQHASLKDIVHTRTDVQWILSVLPPGDARAFVEQCLNAGLGSRRADGSYPVFVDCNAVNPTTSREIADLLAARAPNVQYIDAGIIGGPPRADPNDPLKTTYEPNVYASTSAEVEASGALHKFGELVSVGLPVRIMKDAGVGAASALKMSYAGIMKGVSGLLITMVLASHANSPATTEALLSELAHSSPQILARSENALSANQKKAYRFVGEMREIAQFVEDGLAVPENPDHTTASSSQTLSGPGLIFEGLAQSYTRLAKSVSEGAGDVDVLNQWVAAARKTREQAAS